MVTLVVEDVDPRSLLRAEAAMRREAVASSSVGRVRIVGRRGWADYYAWYRRHGWSAGDAAERAAQVTR